MPKPPKFAPKPAAPSVRSWLPDAVERARSLSRKRLPPDQPATRAEILDEMEARLPLSPALMRFLRDAGGD